MLIELLGEMRIIEKHKIGNVSITQHCDAFRNHCYSGNVTIHCMYVVELYIPINCITRQFMYVSLNIEARSCNQGCSGKAISITHYEGVFLALGIQHAMHMHRIVICGLSGSKIFFYIS